MTLPATILRQTPDLLHVHSNLPGRYFPSAGHSGQQSLSGIVRMAEAAGYRAVYLTEHTANPQQEPRPFDLSSRQAQGILAYSQIVDRFRHQTNSQVYPGLEANILVRPEANGRALDVPDQLAAQTKLVIASIHWPQLHILPPEQILAMMIAALDHPAVDVLGHPGRHLEGVRFPWNEVGRRASLSGTLLEANFHASWTHGAMKALRDHDPRALRLAEQERCFYTDLGRFGARFVVGLDIHHRHMWLAELPAEPSQPTVRNFLYWLEVIVLPGLQPGQLVNNRLPELLPLPKPDRVQYFMAA